MAILETKAALDKEGTKLQKRPAWDESKMTSKAEVIRRAKVEGKTDHFATLRDLCHLKSSELEKKFHKYRGRAVLRGAIPGTAP